MTFLAPLQAPVIEAILGVDAQSGKDLSELQQKVVALRERILRIVLR